jgi:hypothetical protein
MWSCISVATRPGVTAFTVDRDAVVGEFAGLGDQEAALARESLGEANQAGFGRGVVRLTDVPCLARDRGDVDDPAGTTVEHVPECTARHVEGARQIHVEHLVPLAVGQVQGEVVMGDASMLTRMSRRPCWSITSWTTRSQSSGFAMLP